MKGSQSIAVALVTVAVLTVIGARAWMNSTHTAVVAGVQSHPLPVVERPAAPVAAASAPVEPTPTPPPAPRPESMAAVAPSPIPTEAADVAARAEATQRTERFMHSRRGDGQHAE